MDTANYSMGDKVMLTLEEAAAYMGLSKSYLYKLVSWGEITHYKPGGKRVYFHINDVLAWLQHNRIPSRDEINRLADAHLAATRRL
ncbi:helix-turn-helix domain-containing protein [uncultured Alistipes sp.]|jgi:conserved domain protein|uniref:helix-turn-helix domain-containing protein n=1 Tax=uncultured Alistipes sp. TaxID=538949 RepID=UPI0027D952CF|nr:helix-turn-helix domain-containing protein [uncultured Alistipes sp.]